MSKTSTFTLIFCLIITFILLGCAITARFNKPKSSYQEATITDKQFKIGVIPSGEQDIVQESYVLYCTLKKNKELIPIQVKKEDYALFNIGDIVYCRISKDADGNIANATITKEVVKTSTENLVVE